MLFLSFCQQYYWNCKLVNIRKHQIPQRERFPLIKNPNNESYLYHWFLSQNLSQASRSVEAFSSFASVLSLENFVFLCLSHSLLTLFPIWEKKPGLIMWKWVCCKEQATVQYNISENICPAKDLALAALWGSTDSPRIMRCQANWFIRGLLIFFCGKATLLLTVAWLEVKCFPSCHCLPGITAFAAFPIISQLLKHNSPAIKIQQRRSWCSDT